MNIEQQAQRLPYWADLSGDEQQFVCANAQICSYGKNAVIHGCGSSCLGMISLIRGSVRVLMISEEGREITLFRLLPGDSCVLSASCVLSQITFETQLIAEEDTELLVISAGAYAELMEGNLHVKCFTYELAAERFSAVVWVMQQIIFARFDQRLAGFLISRCADGRCPELHMTQEAIAQEVNTAREVVSRMLRHFAADGLIELKRGTILIRDAEKLRALSKTRETI